MDHTRSTASQAEGGHNRIIMKNNRTKCTKSQPSTANVLAEIVAWLFTALFFLSIPAAIAALGVVIYGIANNLAPADKTLGTIFMMAILVLVEYVGWAVEKIIEGYRHVRAEEDGTDTDANNPE